MKTKDIKFKHKKEFKTYKLMTFETIDEARQILGEEEVLNCFDLGNRLASKERILGKDPFKPKRKKLTIELSSLNKQQLAQLRALGLVKE